MSLVNYLYWLLKPNQHRTVRRSNLDRVTLNLEALEERWLPNGTVTAATTPPPSFIQAAITLYVDGIQLEAVRQANLAAFFDDIPTSTVAENLAQFFGNFNIDGIQANIEFNLPYASPIGPFLVQAGRQAVDQILPHTYS